MIWRKRTELTAAHQAPEIGNIENGMHHVGVVASRLPDGEVVATAAVDHVHTGP